MDERLPYVDAHGVEVHAGIEAAWAATVRVLGGALGGTGGGWYGRLIGVSPPVASGPWSPDLEVGTALPGFVVEEVQRPELLSLRGRHRFSRYRLDVELAPAGPKRSQVWARTWAEFPGVTGALYCNLVVRSGAHRLFVRRLLHRIAATAVVL